MPKKSQKFWLTGNKKRKAQSNPQTSAQPFEQSNSSNSSVISNIKEQCPTCLKYFAKLSVHLNKSLYCGNNNNNIDFSIDPSIVCHYTTTPNNSKQTNPTNTTIPNLHPIETLNQHHINLFKSNDNDQSLICINQSFNSHEPPKEVYNDNNISFDETSSTDIFDDHPITIEQTESFQSHEDGDDNSPKISSTNYNNRNIIPFSHSNFRRQVENTNRLMSSYLEANSGTTPQSAIHLNCHLFRDFTKIQHEIKYHHLNHIDLSIEEVHAIEVLKLMIDHQMPSSMFTELMKLQDCYTIKIINERLNYNKIYSYPTLPKQKQKVLKMVSKIIFGGISDPNIRSNYTLNPQTRNIQLPSLKKISSVTKFDVASLILSLLNDTTLTKPSNMLLEDKYFRNPELFESLSDNEKFYGDIHTGSWFLNTFRNICNKDNGLHNDVLCPIIMFIDGTPIDTFGNLKLDAIMFTLGIYNRDTRNKNNSWRLVGYIPDTIDEQEYNDGSLESKSKKLRQKQQRTDYHHNLHYLLQEFIDIQNSKGILWDFTDSKNQTTTIRLRPTLSYIIGDALGNDKLCDRYQSYSKSTKYLCRDCFCESKNLNRFDYKCTFTKRSFLTSLSEKELRDRSYHKVDNNVFDILQFGYDKYGINGCTPCELLHQFLLGLVKKATDNFFECITAPGLSLLKKVSKYISTTWSRQSDRDLPTIQMFNEDLVKKKLTGDENINLVFMLFITLSQTYVSNELILVESNVSPRTKMVQGNKVQFPKVGENRASIQKWVKLLERTLCFYLWIKLAKIRFEDLKQSSDQAFDSLCDITIRKYMKLYNDVVVIPYGNGNQCMKDHQTLHIPHYIRRFGIPSNYDGGIGERHLKQITKQPARMTQKRQSLLSSQACKRYSENLSIRLVYQMLIDNQTIHNNGETVIEPTISGSFTYNINDHGDIISVTTSSNKRKYMKSIHHERSLIKKIFLRLKGDNFGLCGNQIHCFTKLSLSCEEPEKNVILRSDPCFFGNVWFDWCITKWTTDDENNLSYYPARILMFIDTTKMDFTQNVENSFGRYLAIIKTVTDDDRAVRKRGFHSQSSFLKSYKIEDKIRVISCDAIEKSAYVMPDITDRLFDRNISDDMYNNQTISYVLSIESKDSFSDSFIQQRQQQQQDRQLQQLLRRHQTHSIQPSVNSNNEDDDRTMLQTTDVSKSSI